MPESHKKIFDFTLNDVLFSKYTDGKKELYYMSNKISYISSKISQSIYDCALKEHNKQIAKTIIQTSVNKP